MAVHFMMQKKGGVGKSYLSSLFMQYLTDKGKKVLGIDVDPTTATLSGIEGLNAKRIELLVPDGAGSKQVNRSQFLVLCDEVIKAGKDTEIVIDSGASGYPEMCAFLKSGDFLNFLESQGYDVYIHSVLRGGNDIIPTVQSMNELLHLFPTEAFIVWINAYEDRFRVEFEGRGFQDSKLFKEFFSRFASVITVPTYGFFTEDAGRMFSSCMTINQILKRGVFSAFQAHALLCYRNRFWEVLDKAMTDIESYRIAHAEDSKPKI